MIKVAANNPVPLSYLKRAWARNPHGAGFSMMFGNDFETFKGFTTFEDFWKAYSYGSNRWREAVIHFRYSTAGEISEANCHPFLFGRNKYAMAHNGTIEKLCFTGKRSDSNILAKDYLSKWIKKYSFTSKRFKSRIEKFIGKDKYNKLILMSDKGEFLIINEEFGVWKNGNWYSNRDFQFFCSPIRAYRKWKRKVKDFWNNLNWKQAFEVFYNTQNLS